MTSTPLLDHITAARWFGGKGRRPRLVGVTPLPWLRPPGDWPAVRIEIAEIGYPEGDTELYQLLISYRPEQDQQQPLIAVQDPDHGRLAGVDGTDDPVLHAALLETILSGRRSDDDSSTGIGPSPAVGEPGDDTLLAAHVIGAAQDGEPAGLPSRIFAGEQSNTSILYADVALLKIFRRLQPGRNPDIAIHEQLTRAGNRRIARLQGWLTAGLRHDRDLPSSAESGPVGTDLAMLVQQLPNARNGWELALTALGDGQDLSRAAADLGSALADIHRDLRTRFGSQQADGTELADAMATRVAAAALVVPELGPLQAPLSRLLDRLRSHSVDVQRVHGDFHLGQALLTDDGWKIIDFEGEPAKTLAERHRPDSVWRDIAGALRSIDYAAAHRRDAVGDRWSADCRQGFLDGYRRSAGWQPDDSHGSSDPDDRSDPAEQEALLPAYLADKAIYEVVYEARNRPDWLPIPLAAVTALADGAAS
ncbi:phosphotransferase [Microlunatus soli]|uniref:Maltokinase n=1 Tax=Microlunatus soli TaxID=630515 RepID=A0A1H1ZYQ0_9ACTN|nr:phosphotransferase [Microlunatus soli]SDT38803.1 maltokinase [Microlunatus soli]